MKRIPIVLLSILLTSCNGWFFRPSPYQPPTPFLPPTRTPSILSPTPVVIGVNSATPMIVTLVASPTNTLLPPVDTPAVFITDTPVVVATDTLAAPMLSVNVEILGCDTSIDVLHSMGEVTNAYVMLKNTGTLELTNIKVTLLAKDEARVHPDKTIELTSLPVNYEVPLKLTVDSTYHEETPIQIEVGADSGLFQRVGTDACKDIGLFAPKPEGLNTPLPIP